MKASPLRPKISPRLVLAIKSARRNPKNLQESGLSMLLLSASEESLSLSRSIRMRY